MSDGPSTPESAIQRDTRGVQRDPHVKPTLRDTLSEAAITKLENTNISRRTVVGAGIGATGLAILAGLGLRRSSTAEPLAQTTTEITSTPEKKLENDIRFLKKNEEGELTYSDVAQYYEAEFVDPSDPNDPYIKVRNEHRYDEIPEMKLRATEMNDHEIGVIRVAGSDNSSPEDSFFDKKDGYVYEWFLLARLTNDPEKPYVYVDGEGNVSDTPYFVGPNFLTLDQDSGRFIK